METHSMVQSCSCIWEVKADMSLNLITGQWEVTCDTAIPAGGGGSGCRAGGRVGAVRAPRVVALFSTLVVMGRRERPLERKAVLGIISFLKDP